MAMLNESDWENSVDPCSAHDHCEMCGVCETEAELLQEHWAPFAHEFNITIIECLSCRKQGFKDDCP